MENYKIIPTHNGLTRIKTYTLEEIFDYIKANPRVKIMMVGELKVKLQRAKAFLKKVLPVSVVEWWEFFALELDKGKMVYI